MDLIIDVTATDVTLAAVTSLTDRTPVSALKQLVIGDNEPMTVQFTDGAAAPAWASDATYVLTLALGAPDPTGIEALASTSTFTLVASTRTGSIDLSVAALTNYARIHTGGGRWLRPGLSLQVRIATPAGKKITYALLPVVIQSPVILVA